MTEDSLLEQPGPGGEDAGAAEPAAEVRFAIVYPAISLFLPRAGATGVLHVSYRAS